MSVSRRASFVAGIAAARCNKRHKPQDPQHTRMAIVPQDDINTISVVDGSGGPQSPAPCRISKPHPVKSPCPHTMSDTRPVSAGSKGAIGKDKSEVMVDMKACNAFAAAAQSARAASAMSRKPRIQNEVKPFTRESLEKINIRKSNLIRDYGSLPKRSPNLQDGAQLPAKYEPFPPELLGKPVEELDQYVYEKSFCVVSRRFQKHYVQRFNATRSLFLFPPWNKLRTAAIYLCTNQYFDYVVMITILVNCIFLAMTHPIDEAEYIFLGIYSLEMTIKCVARGFILNNYTYLRNPWNWLDFIVILSGYLTSFIEMGNLAGLRTFRVLRALKTVSIMPSLKTIINALLNAVKQLAEVMTLTIFCLMVFALFALQVYMGQLRNKCVLDWTDVDVGNWTEWILDPDNWHYNSRGPELCGNSSGAKNCPHGYICLPNVGDNPNFGYTSFDNLLWSMLTTFQLITLDYWENVYNMIVATGGPIHVIFFTIVVFFGSFYLINLMLAVVAMSYEEEAEANNAERAKEAEEAAANATRVPQEEECTIRTNPPIFHVQGKAGTVSISEDMCGNCQKKASLEILPQSGPEADGRLGNGVTEHGQNGASNGASCAAKGHHMPNRSGAGDEGSPFAKKLDKSYVVIKAKQVGNEIRQVDLEPHGDADPTFLESRHKHRTHPRSTLEAKFNLRVPNPSVSSTSQISDDPRNLLSPPMLERALFDQSSASNYSSADESIRSSINDSGVFNDDPSLGEDKLRVQIPFTTDKGEIINCGNVKRPSKIDIPFVVSIETANDRNCPSCRKYCLGYNIWLRFQNTLFVIVHDMLFDATVTLCIILNTAFLAAEHHGMSEDLKHVLSIGNKVFTSFFTLEAVLKLLCLSKEYFASGWNIFDLVIVIGSLIDLSVESVNGISVLRGMRLMRVLKLAQSWTTMKVLLSIIISTLGALGNLTFLLIIVIYIFAVLGMQLFGKTYTAENFYPDPVPRWNFTDFFHSFMMIFRILCGEWVEPLWDCMRAEAKVGVAESCLAIFLPALVMGNFMVLNLFLALLLNSFNCEELKSRKERARSKQTLSKKRKTVEKRLKEEQAKKHSQITNNWEGHNLSLTHNDQEVKGESGSIVASKLSKLRRKVIRKKGKSLEITSKRFSSNGSLLSHNGLKTAYSEPDMGSRIHAVSGRLGDPGVMDFGNLAEGQSKSLTFEDGIKEVDDKDDENSQDGQKTSEPEPCCPELCSRMFFWATCMDDTWMMQTWDRIRQVIHDIVDNPFFEWTILLLIFASSLSLCFEDINLQDNEELMFILKIVNLVFAVLFTIEMFLKWIAFGLWRYFTSMWTCLDFVIVCVSILSLAIEGSANLTALRSLRTLRALRPLRAISRWQGMKIVVNALMYAIPSIFNVLLVCLVFWLIFSIMGVQFFGGKFHKCVDEFENRLPITVTNDKWECFEKNYTWVNSKITFDHVGHAYLALFQVATFEGWMEVMADAVDAREVDQQPEWEASIYNYFYFIIFIVCGSFFTLNLFIGVIIDNFNMLKKKYEGGVLEMFLTESQKNYYTAMKKLGRKKPQKVIRRPQNELHAIFYDISLSRRFEIAIFVLIFLNMVSMGIEHYNQSRVITFTLEICNALFTTIFSLEALVKIIGLRFQYFTAGWNIFDFVLVIASVIGIVMEDMMTDFPVSPTLLRVVRVFRIGRILRLIKAAKGIRKLLFALMVSLPALFNIGALLALITFIYAIIGMTLFGHVKHEGALNDQVNFETFGRSMSLLFRLVTSAGWNDVLEPLLVTPPDCDPHYKGLPNGNCGHPFVAIVYFVSFIIINFMIVINMYIAIILENFNQAHQEEEIGIVEEDLEMFYTKWSKYDPHATQFINFNQMSDFIASLDSPLGIPKPNTLALVSFDLPIAKGDKIHCLDVLHSLTKHTLGFVDDGSEDFSKLASQMDDKFKKQFPTRKELEIVSSTREWKKLDNAARILQTLFREIRRARRTGERVNIQTQTRAIKKALAHTGSENAARALYQESDIDWKTHSLPSLGRISSDNTLESSGDDYAIRKSVRRTRKNNNKKEHALRSQSMVVTDEDELGDETEETHGSEEFDHFSGYSDQFQQEQNSLRRKHGSGDRHHPNHPVDYEQQHWVHHQVQHHHPHHLDTKQPPQESLDILQSYAEEPPATCAQNPRQSRTSLEEYSEPVPPPSGDEQPSYGGCLPGESYPHKHRRTPSTGSYQLPHRYHAPGEERPPPRQRYSYSDYQQLEMDMHRSPHFSYHHHPRQQHRELPTTPLQPLGLFKNLQPPSPGGPTLTAIKAGVQYDPGYLCEPSHLISGAQDSGYHGSVREFTQTKVPYPVEQGYYADESQQHSFLGYDEPDFKPPMESRYHGKPKKESLHSNPSHYKGHRRKDSLQMDFEEGYTEEHLHKHPHHHALKTGFQEDHPPKRSHRRDESKGKSPKTPRKKELEVSPQKKSPKKKRLDKERDVGTKKKTNRGHHHPDEEHELKYVVTEEEYQKNLKVTKETGSRTTQIGDNPPSESTYRRKDHHGPIDSKSPKSSKDERKYHGHDNPTPKSKRHRHHTGQDPERLAQQKSPRQQDPGPSRGPSSRSDPHRQTIRRQAQVALEIQSSDISDAFDDDGLFHFEETNTIDGGYIGDKSHCKRRRL